MKTVIKYLGIMLDNHLSWKSRVSLISKKIKRSIGMLCKARHYVNIDILTNLYYCLIYPYLIYGIVTWGHTYESTTNSLFILQKKALRLITFSTFSAHTNSIFHSLKIIKFPDLVFLHTALLMHDYYSNNLPTSFKSYFNEIKQKHNYNTRLASRLTYSLPKIRTNYGKFNIKFSGVKIWNEISDSCKKLNKSKFKESICENFFNSYATQS